MGLTDVRGVPVSTHNPTSLRLLQEACEEIHLYRGNPVATLEGVLGEDPGFGMGWAALAGLLTTTTERSTETSLARAIDGGESVPGLNDRERGHLAAARSWLQGDFDGAVDRWGRLVVDQPRDLLALQLAHVGDFYLGRKTALRDRPAQALHAWDLDVPGYGLVLGMHAFGLEENGDRGRAEGTGLEAVELEPRDVWAHHAVAHVYEMEGRVREGIEWITSGATHWCDGSFAYHNFWHLALLHLDRGEIPAVLTLYDTRIRRHDTSVALELVDASALLWRLSLLGIDVGDRFARLADRWRPLLDDGYYAFNDVHAMMALVGAGRTTEIERLLATMSERAQGPGSNARMLRDVGLPVARALFAFGRADYRTAAELLVRTRPYLPWFGGSDAQRDVFTLTTYEAAMRHGDKRLARALASERVDARPMNSLSWDLSARAADLAGDRDASSAARAERDSRRR
jgi:hypothetical protein